ncbi:sigma-70 family RNA polymerase sigma factor [Actinomadura sp. 21ATH]|uniref:sigma-70 family RNA polymerase sigma factor n=1 Tax=Actinomadura sp. 21ATH TaxID=1735444 RepID=UPI0035C21C61
MHSPEFLAVRFEQHRPHLKAVAYRMLGSRAEADDAIQETWLRLARTEGERIENLGGWLTKVIGRICLDMLRTRERRGEEPLQERIGQIDGADPEQRMLAADSVGRALLVVLESLSPAERLAFVLHDMFAVPFDEIAPIVDRTPATAKKLASRARRRVRGATPPPDPGRLQRHRMVDAFLTAARGGDFADLLTLLDPATTRPGTTPEPGVQIRRSSARSNSEISDPTTGR